MKLKELKLRNFRSYEREISIPFDDLTAIVGRNDAGKSTIMEALDIFLNDGTPDKDDASKSGDSSDLAIICTFTDLPVSLILDQTAHTTLSTEQLLNDNGDLEIHKIFNGGLASPKLVQHFARAIHPSNNELSDLLLLNNTQLKERATERGVIDSVSDKKVNAALRAVIRDSVADHNLTERDVLLSEGNGVAVWKGIQSWLPAFALFKSDRASTDQDAEAQDPLKAAIREALKSQEVSLNAISDHVEAEVTKIAELTLQKLNQMDAALASTLKPTFAKPNWAAIFKASIVGDEGIPINKRGSGARRLILLNFFRARAEKMLQEKSRSSVVIAIEEPETSQHPHNQRLLLSALNELALCDQVIVTTHTPVLARAVPDTSIRYLHRNDTGEVTVKIGGSEDTNKAITDALGVLPDHNVRLFIGVEGKHDIPFLKHMSRVMLDGGVDVPDLCELEAKGQLLFIPLGGQSLALWCDRLAGLNRPEFHFYDRDVEPPGKPKYHREIEAVCARPGCHGLCTNRREAENYLHFSAINQALTEMEIAFQLPENYTAFDDVPTLLKDQVNEHLPQSNKWGAGRAKEFLCNSATRHMNLQHLVEIGADDEVRVWFERIGELLEAQAMQLGPT